MKRLKHTAKTKTNKKTANYYEDNYGTIEYFSEMLYDLTQDDILNAIFEYDPTEQTLVDIGEICTNEYDKDIDYYVDALYDTPVYDIINALDKYDASGQIYKDLGEIYCENILV